MSDEQGGWLVVRRYSEIAREPVPPLTHSAIRSRYGGFDGIAWPGDVEALTLSNGLAPPALYREVIDYWKSIGDNETDLVYLTWNIEGPRLHSIHDVRVDFRGYDYGNFVSETNYFSSVLNEVLYGLEEEMARFVLRLNQRLLADSMETIEDLASVRTRLAARGATLEAEMVDEEYRAISIFAPSEPLFVPS